MGLTRRQFLKWAGLTGVGAVVFNGCRVPMHEIEIQSPLQIPEDLVTGTDNYYATAAQLGSDSQSLLVRVFEGRAKKVEGNPDSPLNGGAHGLRAEAQLQALYHPDRIPQPLVRTVKGGPYRPIDWQEALDRLATILKGADPSSVLMAIGPARGRLADVINAFASGYGARVMAFESLDHSVLRAAMKHVFGQEVLPAFDIANTNYLIGFGADFLGTWLSPVYLSRGYGEFRQGENRPSRGRLVQIDTRYSVTARAADKWIYVRPGTEGLLAMAMAYTIIKEGLANGPAADALTGGRGADALANYAPESVAGQIGMLAQDIVNVARTFASPRNRPALAIGGGTAAAYTNGFFNLVAIYSLNHLVGSVNQPGGVIFNPPTMKSQVLPSPLREWKSALSDMQSGKIKVFLVRDANLAYGLPNPLQASSALGQVPTIVSFSSFMDETTAMADLILPGHTLFEEWGSDTPDPGPGFEMVSLQQPVVNKFQDTLAFGDVLLQTGKTLGLQAKLPWATMRDAVRASVQDIQNTGRGSLAPQATFEEYWQRALERGGWFDKNSTVAGPVPTPSPLPATPQQATFAGDPSTYPFYLVPFEPLGIGAGQYAHLPWPQNLSDSNTTVAWITWVEVSPQTASHLGVKEGDVVVVSAANGGYVRAPVYVNPATPPETVAIPFGQGHTQFTRYATGRGANLFTALADTEDQETGAFAWAGTRVSITKTSNSVKMPKRQGDAYAVQQPSDPIVLVQHVNS